MRKALSTLLLAIFVLPVFSPLLALSQSDESGLPACCRRNGKHHCMMSAEEMAALESGRHFSAMHERCPMYPKAIAPVTHQPFALQQRSAQYAAIVSHPTAQRQIEAWARAAEAGARYKRGPPSSVLL